MSETCIFCKIIEGSIPSSVIYEDDEFKVFLDALPSTFGHTLIVPKTHVEDVFGMDEEQGARLFKLAVSTAKKLQKVLHCGGMNILQNSGQAAGQTVFHFHLHLIPRNAHDDVEISWKTTKPSQQAIEQLLTMLREE